MIAPGANIAEGQPVMELETDKAVVEVPSSVSGVVKEVRVKQGEKVKVGQVIFTLEGGVTLQPQPVKHAPVEHVSGQHGARLAFQAAIKAEGKTEEQALPVDQPRLTTPDFTMPAQLGKVAGTEYREPVPAAPHVRRLARELGLDIQAVKGTGPGGRINDDDVKAHSKALLTSVSAASQAPRTHVAEPEFPDFSKWGKVERVSMRGIRRKTAEHLWEAWSTIPHVTQHDKADITELGGIGGPGFSPIVNQPEVAIHGMSRSSMEPVWINGKFEPRLVLPLSLSYDHRLIDGADAARFLRWIAEAFEQPFLLSVQG